jgi:chromosome segregation ATPase
MDKQYKSPDYKLLAFFHHSRDGWKAKAKDRHARIRELQKRIAALEESRRKWREKAETSQSEIATLKEELEGQKRASA